MATLSEALAIARAHHQAGRLELAEEIYRRILAVEPEHAETLHLRGVVAGQAGEYQVAVECIEQAIALRGTQAAFHNNLGEAYRGLGQASKAIACYRRALELKPDSAGAHYNLGMAFKDLGKLEEAIVCYRQALQRNPRFVEAQTSLGAVFQDQGNLDEAIDCYRRALQIDPEFQPAWHSYLCALRYAPDTRPARMTAEYAGYAQRHLAPLEGFRGEPRNLRNADRPLRLGFVSPKFCLGPVGSFLIRTLENLDRDQFPVFCYSNRHVGDGLTARFQTVSAAWRDCARTIDEDLASRIRADQIDILFDLAGHASFDRLRVFARKPAPIQITWIDSVGTTGLGTIDYVLADRYLIPAGAESHYAERVLRLPDGYVCYAPPAEAPTVGPLPAIERGHVTFGSFNQPAKVNPGVVKIWARILRQVPRSRLVLKYGGWNAPDSIRHWQQRFQAEGVGSDRLEFQGHSPLGEYLGEYNHIDVALDPFPHNGGATTCDCLWMGVPVVTCPGETFAGRQSLSHLSNIGFTETIAHDLEEYVDVAVGLVSDLPRLAGMRAGLRQRVAESPLCDGKRFAENLTALLRQVWREWCHA